MFIPFGWGKWQGVDAPCHLSSTCVEAHVRWTIIAAFCTVVQPLISLGLVGDEESRVDSTFLQWLIGQAGVGGLAALALWLLDRSYRDALRREKEVIEQGREDRRQLISVLSENARTFTALQATIENVSQTWGKVRGTHNGDD